MKKMNKKGFTLIEMLVVIAIIAILVAIIIPIISAATEKAREASDAANIRSAIAQVAAEGLSAGKDEQDDVESVTVTMTQTGAFEKNEDMTDIGGYALKNFEDAESVVVSWDAENGEVVVTVDGTAISK